MSIDLNFANCTISASSCVFTPAMLVVSQELNITNKKIITLIDEYYWEQLTLHIDREPKTGVPIYRVLKDNECCPITNTAFRKIALEHLKAIPPRKHFIAMVYNTYQQDEYKIASLFDPEALHTALTMECVGPLDQRPITWIQYFYTSGSSLYAPFAACPGNNNMISNIIRNEYLVHSLTSSFEVQKARKTRLLDPSTDRKDFFQLMDLFFTDAKQTKLISIKQSIKSKMAPSELFIGSLDSWMQTLKRVSKDHLIPLQLILKYTFTRLDENNEFISYFSKVRMLYGKINSKISAEVLGEFLHHFDTLTTLILTQSLDRIEIPLSAILCSCGQLENLQINSHYGISEDLPHPAKIKSKQLKVLHTPLHDRWIVVLNFIFKLRELNLSSSPNFTGATLIPRIDLWQLQIFNLSNTSLTDKGLSYFPQAPRLRELDLFGSLNFTGIGWKDLRFPSLEIFGLAYTNVTDDGLDCLPEMPELLKLNLINCKKFNGQSISRLVCPKIKILELNGTHLTNEGLSTLSNMPELCELHLSMYFNSTTNFKALFLQKEHFPRLEVLDVSYTKIEPIALASLKKMPHLKTLDVRGCTELPQLNLSNTTSPLNQQQIQELYKFFSQ